MAHAGEIQARYRGAYGGDLLGVVYRDHRLGILFAEQPALAYPRGLKGPVEGGQAGQEFLQQFVFAQVKIPVVCCRVVAQVDDIITAIVFWRLIVGVFHEGQERKLSPGQVDLVEAISDRTFQG